MRNQIVRSVTSAAANYRSACRAQSPQAFIAKLSIAIEEADETLMWLNLMVRVKLVKRQDAQPLAREANEIVSVLVASRKTAQARLQERRNR
jgi:four helix bundle protein